MSDRYDILKQKLKNYAIDVDDIDTKLKHLRIEIKKLEKDKEQLKKKSEVTFRDLNREVKRQ